MLVELRKSFLRTEISVIFCVSKYVNASFIFSFHIFRTGKTYLTKEDIKHEQSASVHRSNSFVSNHGNMAVWTSNKLVFDNPLYGLNVDRILGFHDYTLGQVRGCVLERFRVLLFYFCRKIISI